MHADQVFLQSQGPDAGIAVETTGGKSRFQRCRRWRANLPLRAAS